MDQRTNYPLTLGGQPIGVDNLTPPLVSVVVVNWNYAEFVSGMIDSIRAQDYPWFECVVIDNGSTDDSRSVIERHIGGDPRFTVIHLTENLGQLNAVLSVLDRLRGFFVVVADADDLLLSNFLSSHVQVHLALATPVGFTSSNLLEIDQDGRVLSGASAHFARGCESEQRGLKDAAQAARLSAISPEEYAVLSARTILIPFWRAQWVWSPGTSNMYRTSALMTARSDDKGGESDHAFDNYFHHAVQVIAGSALIDRTLSIYRYHGRNSWATVAPPLPTINNWAGATGQRARAHRREVLRTFTRNPEHFDRIFRDRYWATLDLLAAFDFLTVRQFFSDPEIRAILLEAYDALSKHCGERELLAALLGRMRSREWWRFVDKHYAGRTPLTLRAWMIGRLLRSAMPRILRRRAGR